MKKIEIVFIKWLSFQKKMGSTLCSYIVDNLSTETPNIILPGHTSEVVQLFDLIGRQFKSNKEPYVDVSLQLDKMLKDYSNDVSSDKQIEFIDQVAPKAWEILYRLTEPHDAYQRFSTLFRDMKLVNLEAASKHKSLSDIGAKYPHPFSDKKDHIAADAIEFEDRFQRENDKRRKANSSDLIELPRSKRDNNKFKNDRLALKKLYEINRRLPTNYKMVLVTLDNALIELAQMLRIKRKSFADLYIRHPNSFLCSTDLFAPTTNSQLGSDSEHFSMKAEWSWLEALLGAFEGGVNLKAIDSYALKYSIHRDNQFLNKSHEVLKLYPSIHMKLINDWINHLETMIDAHSLSSGVAHEQLKLLFKKDHSSRESIISNFIEYIDLQTEKSWEKFYDTATLTGYDLIGEGPNDKNLVKQTFPHCTSSHFKNVSNLYMEIIDGNTFRNTKTTLLERVSELNDIDSTGYIRAIGFALLFAHADHWNVVELLAERAVNIIEKKTIEVGSPLKMVAETGVSGREAFYLLAVSKRMTAQSTDDITGSQKSLNRAFQALSYERGAVGEKTELPDRIRFDIERENIVLRGATIKRYNGQSVGVKSLKSIVEKSRDHHQTLLKGVDNWLTRRLITNALSNFYMAVLLMKFSGHKIEPPEKDFASERLLDFCLLIGGPLISYPKGGDLKSAPSRHDKILLKWAIREFHNDDDFDGIDTHSMYLDNVRAKIEFDRDPIKYSPGVDMEYLYDYVFRGIC